jgi:hydrogenase/urease accessory protein HupE
MKLLWLVFCTLTCASFIPQAFAHQVDSVELQFKTTDDAWIFKGLLDIAYMLPESRGVADAPPLMRKDVMAAPKSAHDRYVAVAERTMRKLLVLKFNGKTLNWKIDFPDFEKQPLVLPPETGGWALMNTVIHIEPQPGPGNFEVFWNDNLSSELIILARKGDKLDPISVFSGMSNTLLKVSAAEPTSNSNTADTAKPTTALPSTQARALSWLTSGFYHVIPIGLDHILFILGLFLLVPRWKPLLGQSLLFTTAHSITLALAVFGIIKLPSLLVEVLIAASIAWIGIENLFTKKLKPSRLYLVFGFGLLHGLGFASVLREKVGDLPFDQLILPLVSFNVGVELAQIALLICAFILLIPFKKWTPQIQKVGSFFIALAGLFWMYERLFL